MKADSTTPLTLKLILPCPNHLLLYRTDFLFRTFLLQWAEHVCGPEANTS